MFAIECCGLSTSCYIRVVVGLRLVVDMCTANVSLGRMYVTWHLFCDMSIDVCILLNVIVSRQFVILLPHAGSRVVRIDPLRFLAGCRTRRLNQVQSVYHILACCIIVLWFITFYVMLVFVAECSVFWLF